MPHTSIMLATMLTLHCYIVDQPDIDVVSIEKRQTVAELKVLLKKKKPETFASIGARPLGVFKVNVDVFQDDNRAGILDKISKGRHVFPMKVQLLDGDKISDFFQHSSDEAVDVLIEHRPGEPIDNRACSDVVPSLMPGCRFRLGSAGASSSPRPSHVPST